MMMGHIYFICETSENGKMRVKELKGTERSRKGEFNANEFCEYVVVV